MTDIVESKPLSSMPKEREDMAAWIQVLELFRNNGAPEPPIRLRDEIVHFMMWGWYGQKAAAEIERLHAENASLSSRLDIAAQQIGEYIDAFVRQDQEATKLRFSLSEARTTGRREGMESMISWHAKEIERLDEQIAENNAYRIRVGNTAVSMANEYCSLRREVHEQSIAAIRAAMEKA